jgi:RND family efflux transporter MFP subunit
MTQAMEPKTEPQGPKAKKGRVGLVAGVLLSVGLAALVGARVKEKLAERAAMQASMPVAQGNEAAGPSISGAGGEPGGYVQKRLHGRAVRGEPVTWKPTIPVTGTLSPIQEADIGFKVPGRLQSIHVKVGDRVKVGALLATLDGSEASAQAAAAGAGAKAAEIAYEMARDAQKRTDSLFQGNAVSEAERSTMTQRTALALAQLEQAKAQVRLAGANVGNTRVVAPFAGFVTRAPSGVGKFVGPGEPLVHIDDTSVLKLNATLSEADARTVETGDAFEIEGSAEGIGDAVGQGEGASKERPRGKITAVLGSLDPQTRRVPIVGEIKNDPRLGLRSGAFVRARITPARQIPALKFPATALRPGSQDEVIVVRNGRARVVRVGLTLGEGGVLFIRSGLSANDEVLLEPSAETRDGDEITLESGPAEKPAASKAP